MRLALESSVQTQIRPATTRSSLRCSVSRRNRNCSQAHGQRANQNGIQTASSGGSRSAAVMATQASAPDVPSAQQNSSQTETWYALVANATFMFNDVQNEALAEQLREKKRFYSEQNKEMDFFLVSEPAWLDERFSNEAAQVGRPCAALVSTDQQWITFMKLRLDRVLKLELTGLDRKAVFQSKGPVPEFTPPEKWTAPYSPYRKGWWEAFMPDLKE